jgi:hypothetical protein
MGWFLFAALGLAYLAKRSSPATFAPRPTYVGMSTAMLDFVAAVQAHDKWCWAASVQAILASYGILIGQDQIVARVYGSPIHDSRDSVSRSAGSYFGSIMLG